MSPDRMTPFDGEGDAGPPPAAGAPDGGLRGALMVCGTTSDAGNPRLTSSA